MNEYVKVTVVPVTELPAPSLEERKAEQLLGRVLLGFGFDLNGVDIRRHGYRWDVEVNVVEFPKWGRSMSEAEWMQWFRGAVMFFVQSLLLAGDLTVPERN